MKYSKFIIGLLTGITVLTLVSAKNYVSNEDAPRYHITALEGPSGRGMVYDSVTGEYKIVSFKTIKGKTNLKDLITE